jgi:hypothetical protein
MSAHVLQKIIVFGCSLNLMTNAWYTTVTQVQDLTLGSSEASLMVNALQLAGKKMKNVEKPVPRRSFRTYKAGRRQAQRLKKMSRNLPHRRAKRRVKRNLVVRRAKRRAQGPKKATSVSRVPQQVPQQVPLQQFFAQFQEAPAQQSVPEAPAQQSVSEAPAQQSVPEAPALDFGELQRARQRRAEQDERKRAQLEEEQKQLLEAQMVIAEQKIKEESKSLAGLMTNLSLEKNAMKIASTRQTSEKPSQQRATNGVQKKFKRFTPEERKAKFGEEISENEIQPTRRVGEKFKKQSEDDDLEIQQMMEDLSADADPLEGAKMVKKD